MSRRRRPPRLARRLALWALPPELRGPTEGDLREVWTRRRRHRSRIAADLGYWRDALGLLLRFTAYRFGAHRRAVPSTRWRYRGGGPSWLDVKIGARMLVKYPGMTAIGGLGIAVSTAICIGFFAVAMGFLYPDLGLDEDERIVALENWDQIVNNEERQAVHDFVAWRQELGSVEQVSAFRNVARNLITDEGIVAPVWVAQMSASGFEVARVPPLLGRYLLAEDEAPDAPPVVVLGHDPWLTHFGADPDILGRELRLGGTTYTVVGVMPEGYAFPMSHRYWIPLRVDPAIWERGTGPEIFIFGRLAPGVTRAEAQAELAAIGQRSAAAWPETHGHLRPRVLPYTYPLTDIQDMTIWDFAGMQLTTTLLVLVVALNVAVLSYARTATRRGEIAIRSALGAGRARIVVQLFVEAFVLAAIGTLGGLTLAQAGLTLVNRIMAFEVIDTPFWGFFRVDAALLPYVLALVVLAAIVVGVLPALQATGRRRRATLAQLSGGAGLRLGATWTVLIVAQVAMAVFGLTAAMTIGWGIIEDSRTRPVFSARETVVLRQSFDAAPPRGVDVESYARALEVRRRQVEVELLRGLEEEPFILDLTRASDLPGFEGRSRIEIDGAATPAVSAAGHRVRSGRVATDFFAVVEGAVLAGRAFEADDLGVPSRTAVVNRAFVGQLLEGDDALGRRFRYRPEDAGAVEEGEWYEIVGVVEDLHANPVDPTLVEPTVYHPLPDDESALIIARIRGELDDAVGRLRTLAVEIDPTLLLGIRSLASFNRQEEIGFQLMALVLVSVTTAVVLLSAGGIYALMSFAVTRQRREIGIRTALGARPASIVRGVFSRAALQLGAGIGLGVILALAAGVLSEPIGPLALPVMTALVTIVGVVAALGPARRGLRVDPSEALRAE